MRSVLELALLGPVALAGMACAASLDPPARIERPLRCVSLTALDRLLETAD